VEERPSRAAAEVLQVATTVAAVAIALAALTEDEGPSGGGIHAIPAIFLIAGLLALIASLYALSAVWTEEHMSPRDLLPRTQPLPEQPDPNAYLALVFSMWGLLLLGVAYLVLLVDNATKGS
jgi:hypothetical protein